MEKNVADKKHTILHNNSRSEDQLNRITEAWLKETARKNEILCPVEASKESPVSAVYSTAASGKRYLVVITNPSTEPYPYFVKIPYAEMLKTVMKSENCAGIVVDPYEDSVFISKERLKRETNGKRRT